MCVCVCVCVCVAGGQRTTSQGADVEEGLASDNGCEILTQGKCLVFVQAKPVQQFPWEEV